MMSLSLSLLAEQHHHHTDSPKGLSMMRNGSGTAWQPDASPMAMYMANAGDWHFMFHENMFVFADTQSSFRGGSQIASVNWLMASASHKVGPGDLTARVMLSLEPLTVPGRGYPLLFQSGETWQGATLHDAQHPHDLFMEVASFYALPLGDDYGLDLYIAPSGEPALGPVAFPHRSSARSNPFAPLGHHWYDSTHISFGVLTLGFHSDKWKVEGSWFNGREPDENRYNFDLRPFDSYSARVWYNPSAELSMQASYGFLKSPEAQEPDVSVHRVTTSASLNGRPWEKSNLAASMMAGINIPSEGVATAFGLAEMDFDLSEQHTVFSRIELGNKTGEELVLAPDLSSSAFALGAFSVGYAFKFPTFAGLQPALGGVATLNVTGPKLGTYYNGQVQGGGLIYLQLRVADGMH